jgi:hypothetical protein
MLLDKLSIKLHINLEPGVYIFTNYSATGKTRLCNLLKDYMILDDTVLSITYNDVLLHKDDTKSYIKPGKQRLLMLDRYDLYSGFATEEIKEFSKTGVVLIDTKYGLDFIDDIVYIKLYLDRIEVNR